MTLTMPKFYYFNIRGLGEQCRLAFNVAGLPFEDIRIPKEEWANKYKPMTPTGQVPMLVFEDGTQITESRAILCYIGLEGGLMPTDNKLAAKVFQIVEYSQNFQVGREIYNAKDEEKPKLVEKLNAEVLGPCAQKLDKIVAATQNEEGYCVGGKLSIADIVCTNLYDTYCVERHWGVNIDESTIPHIVKSARLVQKHPKYAFKSGVSA